jgi:glycosyltransferase involved in cell wall biosynthesis
MIKISVIIPNYNHAKYLPDRIESILNQTYSDYEIIILDDCSQDDSWKLIENYRKKYPNLIRTHRNNRNSGSTFLQWNKGISLARGKYIWIAESDDEALPDFLATLVPILNDNPKIGLAYSMSDNIDENGKFLRKALPYDTEHLDIARWERDFKNSGKDEAGNYLLYECTIPNASAVLFRKSLFISIDEVPTHMKLYGDLLTYLKMIKNCDIYFHSTSLNKFRVHTQSIRSKNKLRTPKMLIERHEVLKYIREHLKAPLKHDLESSFILLRYSTKLVLRNPFVSLREFTIKGYLSILLFAFSRNPILLLIKALIFPVKKLFRIR